MRCSKKIPGQENSYVAGNGHIMSKNAPHQAHHNPARAYTQAHRGQTQQQPLHGRAPLGHPSAPPQYRYPTHPMPNFPMFPQHFGYFPNVNQTHTGSNQLPMFSSPYSQAYNPFVQPQPAPSPNPASTPASDQHQAGNSQETAEEQNLGQEQHDLEDSQVMEQEEASQEVLQESAEVIAEADIHPAPVE